MAQIEADSRKTYTIDGIEGNNYDWSQRIRNLESAVRREKREPEIFKASGDNAGASQCRERIKAYQSKYKEISEVTGIAEDRKRMAYRKGNVLTSDKNNDIVNTKIDELTPCLRRLNDNKIVDTEVFEIKPNKKDFSDWKFDRTLPQKTGHSIYAIKAKGNERIQGLVAMKSDRRNLAYHIDIAEAAPFNNPHHKSYIKKEYDGIGGHLFAEAVRKSYEDGFGGAVYFTAKSDLIEHY